MSATIQEGGYSKDASLGGDDPFASIEKYFEASRGEFGKEESKPLFNDELQNQDLEKSYRLIWLFAVFVLSFL